jgi:hypothetical protein
MVTPNLAWFNNLRLVRAGDDVDAHPNRGPATAWGFVRPSRVQSAGPERTLRHNGATPEGSNDEYLGATQRVPSDCPQGIIHWQSQASAQPPSTIWIRRGVRKESAHVSSGTGGVIELAARACSGVHRGSMKFSIRSDT